MADLRRFNSINRMLGELKLLTRSENTEKTYLKGINAFVGVMNIDDLDVFVEKIKSNTMDADETYKEFVVNLANKNLAPKTVGAWSASVKKFLMSNGVELKRNVSMKMYNVHEDMLPSKEDLKGVVSSCGLRTKAIILTLASSGLRVGELRNLKMSDIDMNSSPGMIRIKGLTAKERKSRMTFISDEAKKLLQSYLENKKSGQPDSDQFVFTTHSGV